MLRFVLLLALLSPLAHAQTFTAQEGLSMLDEIAYGATIVDADGDGRADLLFGPSVLRRADSGWELTRSSEESALGALVADWDHDGVREAAVLGFNQIQPVRWSRARGAFEPLAGSGLRPTTFDLIQGSVLLDENRDGRLDLLIGNDGPPDVLFRQNASGAFTDVSASVLPGTSGGTYGMAAADYDQDGDPDVAVGLCFPDPAFNLFYEHDGTRFDEVASSNGSADPRPSWGVVWLDYDTDGWLDLFVANMPLGSGTGTLSGANRLYRNNGMNGAFQDVSDAAGVAGPSTEDSWSAAAADFDNDGHIDIAVANQQGGGGAPEPWRLWRNTGGQFEDATAGSGVDAFEAIVIAAGDVDGDGWVDLVSLTQEGELWRPHYFRNNGGANHWLAIRLRGTDSNAEGIGARVEVASGGRTQVREITGGDGIMSQSHALEAHVGLGDETTADVTVRWPSGQVDVLTGVTADQRITIVEGEGRNDPPGTFALLGPEDGAQLQSGIPSVLSWEPAADDGPVTYTVLLESESGEAVSFTTSETSFTLPPNGSVPAPGLNYWTVVASDGVTERTSTESRSFSFIVVDAIPTGPLAPEARLEAWPNPTAGTIRVSASGLPIGEASLEVVDALGRLVLSRSLLVSASGEADMRLDLGALPTGPYAARVRHAHGTTSATLVISR